MTNTKTMDELEKNMPDNFWRKTFDEAEETPPPRVWASIERRLDEAPKTKILPLWGEGYASSHPVVWGASIAAAVALLLVGWWALNSPSEKPSMATSQPSEKAVLAPAIPTALSAKKSQGRSTESVPAAKPSVLPESFLTKTEDQSVLPSTESQVEATALTTMSNPSRVTSELRPKTISVAMLTATQSVADFPLISTNRVTVASFAASHSELDMTATKSTESISFEPLMGQPLRLSELKPSQRVVWIQPAKSETTKSKHKSREVWASVSVLQGGFNPNVSVQSATTTDALKAAVSSRPNFSVAYQAGVGVQLTDHWSVESGIGYLSGRSTVEAPAQLATNSLQAVADRNGTAGNLYADALRNSLHNTANSATILVYPANYSSQTRQALTNDYRYVQVPVQVGYQLRPRKRLSLALLGGILTNIFSRNTVGSDVVVTAKDGVYRPVSFAAIMGARLRYRPSRQWSASLAGIYQPSLGLGTQPDSQVQSQPTLTGMSLGVDYHF